MSESTDPALLPATVDYIRQQMQEQGLTVPALANLTGVPQDTINNIIYRRTRNPGFECVATLVYALGGSLDALAGHGVLLAEIAGTQKDAIEVASHVERGWSLALAHMRETAQHERRSKIVLFSILMALLLLFVLLLINDLCNGTIGYIRYQTQAGAMGRLIGRAFA